MKFSKAAASTPPAPIIIDIRREEVAAANAKDIADGLNSSPKQLPELLVHDGHGLQYFSEITKSTGYYPRHSEIKTLFQNVSKMVGNLRDGDVYIELGARCVPASQYPATGACWLTRIPRAGSSGPGT